MKDWQPLRDITKSMLPLEPDVESVWANDDYIAWKHKPEPAHDGWPPLVAITFKKHSKSHTAHDWRAMQWIKNQLVGEECEAVEVFPAESRLVDTCNQYHLWVSADPKMRFPFGFGERLIAEGPDKNMPNTARQRPWPSNMKPADALTDKEIRKEAQRRGAKLGGYREA